MMMPQQQRPQAPPVSPQQQWWNMISARPQGSDPNAPAQAPTNPYNAFLNLTSNMGWQGPQQGQPQPGQQGQPQQPAAYRNPQNALNIAQMGLGMLQPRPPYR
jgi:hypothetical protein